MEVDTTRQTITVNKLINTKREMVTIEGDMIVPDVKPDILSTIDTVGNVCIYKKEVLDQKVRFDGSINLNVIYLADTDNDFTRGLNTTLDFTQIMDIENCKAGMNLKNNINIKNIECKVLNGRKINVKVILEIEVFVYSNEEINILKEVNNIENMQTLDTNIQINNLVGIGSCRACAKDTITLQQEDNLAEILKTEINVMNNEMKVSYNKILLKADANVKIMYLTENGEIKTISSNIPIMGFLDMSNVSDTDILTSNYEMKNIIIKPNSTEQHSIYVEIEFEIMCDAVNSMDIDLIQDMYCPNQEIQFNKKEVTTMTNKQVNKNICNVRERVSVPEISNNKIYDVEINPNINNMNVLNGRIIFEGDLNLNFIFSSDANTRIDTKQYTLPFNFNIDNENASPNKTINTKINCINNEFVITTDGMIECKVDLEFELEMYNNVNINVIDQINTIESEENSNPSMIIYIVKQGDTLWNIAKKYRTTVENITLINKLENPDMLNIGQKLFIPRYNVTKITNIA